MPEQNNDKLESFFQKAAGRPDIPFNEDDWKKLEARLDAKGTRLSVIKGKRIKIAGAIFLAAALFFGRVWLSKDPGGQKGVTNTNNAEEITNKNVEVPDPSSLRPTSELATSESNKEGIAQERITASKERVPSEVPQISSQNKITPQPSSLPEAHVTKLDVAKKYEVEQSASVEETETNNLQGTNSQDVKPDLKVDHLEAHPYDDTVGAEILEISPAMAEKNKQKASVELPGAMDDGKREAEAIGEEENVSDQEKHLAPPRLSLLLSLAPDFSSIAYNDYDDPGRAMGVMVHYHVKKSWSLSAGVVMSHKKYTAAGSDYKPPKGYWKFYTNGIVPNSIDGSCNILEIPIMLQYTVATVGKSKFLVGAGASSYIMLNESYSYNFEQPNPGAKEGWDTDRNSSFIFNMVNFTVGFEHQILPGLMLGVEPYMKIPMEGIGWSKLKLFSTGASFTLRYNLLKRKYSTPSIQGRGPG